MGISRRHELSAYLFYAVCTNQIVLIAADTEKNGSVHFVDATKTSPNPGEKQILVGAYNIADNEKTGKFKLSVAGHEDEIMRKVFILSL